MVFRAGRLLDQDVLGLDVPVDDAVAVCAAQPGEHLPRDRNRAGGSQAPLIEQGTQGHAVHQVHDQVGKAIDPEVDDGDAVRVRQAAHGSCLHLEPPGQNGVPRDRRVQKFDGDRAPEPQPLATMHGPHTPLGDGFQQPIAALKDRPRTRAGGVPSAFSRHKSGERGHPPFRLRPECGSPPSRRATTTTRQRARYPPLLQASVRGPATAQPTTRPLRHENRALSGRPAHVTGRERRKARLGHRWGRPLERVQLEE